jgi:hypothetical protein
MDSNSALHDPPELCLQLRNFAEARARAKAYGNVVEGNVIYGGDAVIVAEAYPGSEGHHGRLHRVRKCAHDSACLRAASTRTRTLPV